MEQSKWSLFKLRQRHLLTLVGKTMIKILNLKSITMWEYRNIKHFYKRFHYRWVWRFFVIRKVKNTMPWTYAIEDLNGEEKKCKRQIKKSLELKSNKKVINYIPIGKTIIISLIAG